MVPRAERTRTSRPTLTFQMVESSRHHPQRIAHPELSGEREGDQAGKGLMRWERLEGARTLVWIHIQCR
jgi:hypothetical protein